MFKFKLFYINKVNVRPPVNILDMSSYVPVEVIKLRPRGADMNVEWCELLLTAAG